MINLQEKIDTNRTTLRRITNEDTPFIYNHFGDEDVCKYLVDNEPVQTVEEAKKIIDWCNEEKDVPTQYRWIIEYKDTGKPIGTVGFHRWDRKNNISEIGYDLSKDYWNQGIMSEVLIKVIEFGFNKMSLNRVEAYVHIENIPSYNVLKKIGFTFEGIIRDKHYFRGKYYDHFCLSILKKQYIS